MATSPTYPSSVASIAKTILPADTTNWVDIYDNSASPTKVRVEALIICSDDTASVNIQIGKYVGATTYLMGTVRAVTLSGTNGATARVDALATVGNVAPDGINVIELAAGSKLQAKSLVAVSANKTVTVTGWVRQYA
jgi:hypothetical protein